MEIVCLRLEVPMFFGESVGLAAGGAFVFWRWAPGCGYQAPLQADEILDRATALALKSGSVFISS